MYTGKEHHCHSLSLESFLLPLCSTTARGGRLSFQEPIPGHSGGGDGEQASQTSTQ